MWARVARVCLCVPKLRVYKTYVMTLNILSNENIIKYRGEPSKANAYSKINNEMDTGNFKVNLNYEHAKKEKSKQKQRKWMEGNCLLFVSFFSFLICKIWLKYIKPHTPHTHSFNRERMWIDDKRCELVECLHKKIVIWRKYIWLCSESVLSADEKAECSHTIHVFIFTRCSSVWIHVD